jgi:hypothetical protein
MRVYVPATLAVLSELAKVGELGPQPLTAYAVTPALREWYVEGNEEELEYAALTEAARASLRLLAADPLTPRRRAVVAAEVADAAVSPVGSVFSQAEGIAPGQVRIAAPVRLAEIASIHLDELAAEPTIEQASLAVQAADAGDEDARFTVDGAEDYDLLWFATQELPELL